jgi:hypothetical protein
MAMADHLGSSHVAGFISFLVLALVSATRFGTHLQGAGTALHFNVLVAVAGALSQTEPSLLVVQRAVVLPFVGVTLAVIKPFRQVRGRSTSVSAAARESASRWS